MKLSNYAVDVPIENDKFILYNTLKRKYFIYNKEEKSIINSLLDNINKNSYDLKEIEYMKKFIENGIIIKDDLEEMDLIEFAINKRKFGNDTLTLVIQPTLDCNFRCVYCYEEHKNVVMNDETEKSILKYIKKNINAYKKIFIGWFGGEPLLEKDRIISLTHKIKAICKESSVEYSASMTTNGYLFTDDFINQIEDISINKVQITIDGPKEYHDTKRPLINGGGTYERIIDNILKLTQKNVLINLRINIDKENVEHIDSLFDQIPIESREKIIIYISNLFQSKENLKTFDIYLKAIEKGFKFNNTGNSFIHCEVCKSNGITIEPDGKVVPCSMASENGYKYGYINSNGSLILKNENLYYKIKNTSPLKNNSCRACKKLPICAGGCSLARYEKCNYCTENSNDCLNIDEVVKLHYYHDEMIKRIKKLTLD